MKLLQRFSKYMYIYTSLFIYLMCPQTSSTSTNILEYKVGIDSE